MTQVQEFSKQLLQSLEFMHTMGLTHTDLKPENILLVSDDYLWDDEKVICEVDDDGIGREMSRHNKPFTPVIHESKGVHLSQERLNLGNLLNEMNATIETKDKYYDGVAAGTLVTLTFNLN